MAKALGTAEPGRRARPDQPTHPPTFLAALDESARLK